MIGKSSLGTTIKLVVVASSKIEYNLAIKMRTSWACSHGWIASPAQRKKPVYKCKNIFWNLFVAQGQSWCPILTQLPVIHNPTLGADQTILVQVTWAVTSHSPGGTSPCSGGTLHAFHMHRRSPGGTVLGHQGCQPDQRVGRKSRQPYPSPPQEKQFSCGTNQHPHLPEHGL